MNRTFQWNILRNNFLILGKNPHSSNSSSSILCSINIQVGCLGWRGKRGVMSFWHLWWKFIIIPPWLYFFSPMKMFGSILILVFSPPPTIFNFLTFSSIPCTGTNKDVQTSQFLIGQISHFSFDFFATTHQQFIVHQLIRIVICCAKTSAIP